MKKLVARSLLILLTLISVLVIGFLLQPVKSRGGLAINNKYIHSNNWPALTNASLVRSPTAVSLDTSKNVVVLHRAGRGWPLLGSMPTATIEQNTVVVLDQKTGKLKSSWGKDLFIMPHGLTVDGQNNVWITDVGLHQVFKFTDKGKLIMKLGVAGVPGNDIRHFDKPTAVAVDRDGSFYVSDGYGNSRIVKFTANGKYLLEWGKKGSGNGEFNIPHSITLDDFGKVYVADRENKRIQVFSPAGRFIAVWTDPSLGHVTSVFWNHEFQRLVATDDLTYLYLKHRGSDILIFNRFGKVIERFGRTSEYAGSDSWYHAVCADDHGDLYAADLLQHRVMKFSSKDKR